MTRFKLVSVCQIDYQLTIHIRGTILLYASACVLKTPGLSLDHISDIYFEYVNTEMSIIADY